MKEVPTRPFARLALIAASLGGGVALAGFLLWGLAEVWLLIFAGLLFAVFMRSLVGGVMDYSHLPHAIAYAVVLVVFAVLLAATLFVFLPLFSEGIDAVTRNLPANLHSIGVRLSHYTWGRNLMARVEEINWATLTAGTLSRLAGFFSNALGAISALLMIVITGLYLAADPQTYVRGALALIPPGGRPRAAEILEAMRGSLTLWIWGRLASMIIVGLLTWVALAGLKIPFAATLALLAGLLSFIPNFGPIISAIPAILIGAGKSPLIGFYVFLSYVVVQVIESYFATPFIVRKTLDLPPATVLILQIAFGALYGFLGLLLATPLTVVLMVLVRTIYIEEIMGERASP